MSVVELRGGLHVSVEAVALALDLERRQHVLSVTADGKLNVSHGSQLTAEDRAAITAQRLHLMAVATYQAPPIDA